MRLFAALIPLLLTSECLSNVPAKVRWDVESISSTEYFASGGRVAGLPIAVRALISDCHIRNVSLSLGSKTIELSEQDLAQTGCPTTDRLRLFVESCCFGTVPGATEDDEEIYLTLVAELRPREGPNRWHGDEVDFEAVFKYSKSELRYLFSTYNVPVTACNTFRVFRGPTGPEHREFRKRFAPNC